MPNRAFPPFEVQSHADKRASTLAATTLPKNDSSPSSSACSQLGMGLEVFWQDLRQADADPIPRVK
eukprot:292499-Pyramimonas_sp.AAC.1